MFTQGKESYFISHENPPQKYQRHGLLSKKYDKIISLLESRCGKVQIKDVIFYLKGFFLQIGPRQI